MIANQLQLNEQWRLAAAKGQKKAGDETGVKKKNKSEEAEMGERQKKEEEDKVLLEPEKEKGSVKTGGDVSAASVPPAWSGEPRATVTSVIAVAAKAEAAAAAAAGGGGLGLSMPLNNGPALQFLVLAPGQKQLTQKKKKEQHQHRDLAERRGFDESPSIRGGNGNASSNGAGLPVLAAAAASPSGPPGPRMNGMRMDSAPQPQQQQQQQPVFPLAPRMNGLVLRQPLPPPHPAVVVAAAPGFPRVKEGLGPRIPFSPAAGGGHRPTPAGGGTMMSMPTAGPGRNPSGASAHNDQGEEDEWVRLENDIRKLDFVGNNKLQFMRNLCRLAVLKVELNEEIK